jgi:hypothetical protein
MYASDRGLKTVVEALLTQDADVNIRNNVYDIYIYIY